MRIYLDLAILLNFLVDFLLLLGTNRLTGHPPGAGRAALAGAAGALYAGACLLPGFGFLGNLLWQLVSLGLMGLLAFGWQPSALRRTVLFVFLSMALGGIALGLGKGGFWALVAAAAGVCLLCAVGFSGKAGGAAYTQVELTHRENTVRLTALQDTGNTLRDPITGEQVLVIGAEPAQKLTGLTREQLKSPVETLSAGVLPGLRLIPYRAVGQAGGLLLALRMGNVKIGGRQGAAVVAFAPEGLEGSYQALTGGVL